MIELIYGDELAPNYYIINNVTKGQNYAYHDKTDYLQWVLFDGEENVTHGELKDLKGYVLVDEFKGRNGNCKALEQRS